MNIRLADIKDAAQIAKIHQHEINQGFLGQLGPKFLLKLYESMINSDSAFVTVADKDDQIIGFVGGCTDVGKFYKNFYKKYAVSAFFILLPKIFNLSNLKKIFETLKYSKQKKEKIPGAELLTIAVLKEFHGQDIALKMFEHFVQEMKKRKIKEFKVLVGENLSRAIRFYEKMGFEFHSLTSVHQDKSSKIYLYNIK